MLQSSLHSLMQIFARNVNTRTVRAASFLRELVAIAATQDTSNCKATASNAHLRMMPVRNVKIILFATSASLGILLENLRWRMMDRPLRSALNAQQMMAVTSVQTTFASHACQVTSSVKTIYAINVELTKMGVTSVTISILVRNAQTKDLFSQRKLTNVSVILAKDLRRT
jgi:hypothetical protein